MHLAEHLNHRAQIDALLVHVKAKTLTMWPAAATLSLYRRPPEAGDLRLWYAGEPAERGPRSGQRVDIGVAVGGDRKGQPHSYCCLPLLQPLRWPLSLTSVKSRGDRSAAAFDSVCAS